MWELCNVRELSRTVIRLWIWSTLVIQVTHLVVNAHSLPSCEQTCLVVQGSSARLYKTMKVFSCVSGILVSIYPEVLRNPSWPSTKPSLSFDHPHFNLGDWLNFDPPFGWLSPCYSCLWLDRSSGKKIWVPRIASSYFIIPEHQLKHNKVYYEKNQDEGLQISHLASTTNHISNDHVSV